MAKKINLTIDGINVSVDEGMTILEAARTLNIHIPTLCYHEDLCVAGNCRVCVVEQEKVKNLPASCAMPVAEGMVIHTNSMKVRMARKHIVELLLSEHNADCTKCYKTGTANCRDWHPRCLPATTCSSTWYPIKNIPSTCSILPS